MLSLWDALLMYLTNRNYLRLWYCSYCSFCLFILFMGFSRQEYWSGLPFPSPVDHILSGWSDWVVFFDYGFSVSVLCCPLATLTVLLGFLLSWTWGISSRLLQQSAASAPSLGRGLSPHCRPSIPSILNQIHLTEKIIGSTKYIWSLTLLTFSAIIPFLVINIFHLYNFNMFLIVVPGSSPASLDPIILEWPK